MIKSCLPLVAILVSSSLITFGQNNKSSPDVHLIKKNLHVDGNISSAGGKDLIMQTNTITRMVMLNSSGYVGIGTLNPTELLEVAGNVKVSDDLTANALIASQIATSQQTITGDLTVGQNLSIGMDATVGQHLSTGSDLSVGGNAIIEGQLRLGVTDPTAQLDLSGDLRVRTIPNDNSLEKVLVATDEGNLFYRDFSTVGQWKRDDLDATNISYTEGNVGIGTSDTRGFKLAVNGSIITEEVKVRVRADWPDYVFDPSRKLRTLTELEDYINRHRHLPGIPLAKEVEAEGINIGEMNAKLLEKVEELTLYILQLHEEMSTLRDELRKIKSN